MERVGFGKRALAALIDGLILLVPMLIVSSLFGPGGLGTIVSMAIAGGYLYLDVSRAQTVGKKFMGLKVMGQDGNPASHEVLMKRWGVRLAPGVLSALGLLTGIGLVSTFGSLAGLVLGVGCFMTLGADKLALHDRIVQTAVYRVQPQSA